MRIQEVINLYRDRQLAELEHGPSFRSYKDLKEGEVIGINAVLDALEGMEKAAIKSDKVIEATFLIQTIELFGANHSIKTDSNAGDKGVELGIRTCVMIMRSMYGVR